MNHREFERFLRENNINLSYDELLVSLSHYYSSMASASERDGMLLLSSEYNRIANICFDKYCEVKGF